MHDTNPETKKLVELIEQLEALKKDVLQQATRSVDLVMAGVITDKAEIEKILDSLLDFGDDSRFFELFQKLCRHIYHQYPDVAVEYVNIFRMMFDSDREE